MTVNRTWQQNYLQQVAQVIDTHGVAIQGVLPDDHHTDLFAYTVGLTAHGHPELLIFGLPSHIAQEVLNSLALPVVRDGHRVEPGVRRDVFACGVPATIIDTNPALAADYVTVPRSLYGVEQVPVLQVCYPDSNGRWQWQDGSHLRRVPLLGAAVA